MACELLPSDIDRVLGAPVTTHEQGGEIEWRVQGYFSGHFKVFYDPNCGRERVLVYYRTHFPNAGLVDLYLCDLETKDDLVGFYKLLVRIPEILGTD